LLGVAAVALVMFLLRRFGPARGNGMQPAMAGAGAGGGAGGLAGSHGSTGTMPSAWNQPRQDPAMERSALPVEAASPSSAGASASPAAVEVAAAAAPVARAFVPAAFDSEGFERTAKMIFIRMQAANDTADLDDLRRFTTPELFASLRLDLQERGPAAQTTDVVKVDAKVLDTGNEGDRQVVSVRFQGQVVEEKGAAPTDFNEIWHLVRPLDGSREWAIAGIEQMN
jgi:predicted lipid-binding transport protein (Tim44 family)